MKTAMLAFVIGVSALSVGCSSAPSVKWSNLTMDESASWQKAGYNVTDASLLAHHGLAPTDARTWVNSGIKSPHDIVGWHSAGFTPNEALRYRLEGKNLNDAK